MTASEIAEHQIDEGWAAAEGHYLCPCIECCVLGRVLVGLRRAKRIDLPVDRQLVLRLVWGPEKSRSQIRGKVLDFTAGKSRCDRRGLEHRHNRVIVLRLD